MEPNHLPERLHGSGLQDLVVDLPSAPKILNALIIEDSPVDLELLARQLGSIASRRIHIESFDLLSSGLRRLAQGGIDIVFLDLSLPDSTGIDTLINTAYSL